MENWMPVIGYEGIYEVSNTGKVKSLERFKYCGHHGSLPHKVKEKILHTRVDRLGYERVKLSKDSKSNLKYMHRLIATAFIPNPNHYKEINHKDGCKTNNSIENLEWCTRSQNMKHAVEKRLWKPRTGEDNGSSKLSRSDVIEIRYLHFAGMATQKDLARIFGVTIATISGVLLRKTWKDVV